MKDFKKDENVKFQSIKGKKPKKLSKQRRDVKWKGEKTNDVSWHTKNATTVADIMSYPFNVIVGDNFNIMKGADFGTRDVTPTGYAYLMSVDHDWYTGGLNGDTNSAVNSAASNLYAFMRQHNSGSVNYQRMDLFTSVMIGTIDVLATIAYCDKIFGIVDYYSNRNRTIPRALFRSMCISYDDFVNNLANYRAAYNMILAKATSLVMPKEYPIVDQLIAIYKDIHKDYDSDTGREQIYNVVKPVFHIYDPTGDPNGGFVRLVTWGDLTTSGSTDVVYLGELEAGNDVDSYKRTYMGETFQLGNANGRFNTLLAILNAQINALITDDDYNTMAGDIMKAFDKYGQGEFWTFQPITRDYKMEVRYSEEFSKQFHNATILPHVGNYAGTKSGQAKTLAGNVGLISANVVPSTSYVNETRQDPNLGLKNTFTLVARMTSTNMAFNQKAYEGDILVDSDNVNPSPEEVLTITRWQNRYNVSVGDYASGWATITFTPKAVSSMIFMNARIWYTMWGGNYSMQCNVPFLQMFGSAWTGQVPSHVLKQQFHACPISYYNIVDNSAKGNTYPMEWYVDGELDNAVAMDGDVLKRSHEVDFYSLFNVPFVGKF